MLSLFFYFGIWLFVAWVIETAFGKILWTVFWFTPFVRRLFFGNKKPAEAPRQEAKPSIQEAKPSIPENRPEAATGSFNATQQAPKRFSKAVPESVVKFPVPNRAGRIVPASFQKGIPEVALVMAPRRIRPWKAVPAVERSRACREYFAYRLKLPWILAASPALLARFLFGHPTWSIYNNDRIYKSKSFATAGEEGSVFHALMTNEYMFADLCRQFDLVCNTLGDRNLASSYILDKNLGLTSLKRCTPDALVIDAGTWANPALKSVPLSNWCAGAAAAGLVAGLGLALFSGDIDGAELKEQLESLTSWDADPEPFIEDLAREAEELHQKTFLGTDREERDTIEDEKDFFGFGFNGDSDGVGEYAGSGCGGRYYESSDFDYGDSSDSDWGSGGADWSGNDGGWGGGWGGGGDDRF